MQTNDNNNQVYPSILIIAYNFLPFFPSFGGVARAFYLYKVLKKSGYDTSILSATGQPFGYFGHHNSISEGDVYYVRSYINESKTRLKSNNTKASRVWLHLISFLKKLAQSLLIPDYSIIDLFSFWKKLRSIVHDKNIQIIIITVPKHGISLIAIFAKFFYKHKVNIILDYRDSWNTQPIFCQTSFFGNIISRYFEKLVLNNIDYFTFVSPIVPKLIKTELGIDLSNRSLLIYNGFDSSLGIRYRESNIIMGDKLKLMYIGSANDRLKSYRNVSFLFEYTIHNPNVYIDFYGELELTNHNLQQYPNISFKGSVPTNKLKEISADYNWCIVLHTDKNSSREVIPGKFYDCINLKLPVLCLADQNSEVSQMVSRYNIGIVCNPSIKDILDNQHKLFDNDLLNLLNTNLTNDSLQLFERDNQLLKFLDIIKAI